MSAEADEQKPRKKRLGVDESLIIQGTRKRKHEDADHNKSVLNNRIAPATTAQELSDVREKGLVLYEKMIGVQDTEGRQIHTEFLRLPKKAMYPDYYETIKKPISYNEIKQKIEKSEYTTVYAIVADFSQIFVNAKRYNAPGSPIFLDAKFLHKYLKDLYDDGAGDLTLDDDQNAREDSAPAPPVAPGHNLAAAAPISIFQPGHSPFPPQQKRGPTLKPWLAKKLSELVSHRDSGGRQFSNTFHSLPDRKAWPEYYNIITHPMSLEIVTQKVNKRQYTNVKQFQDDVDVIFANALYFNEETSRVWKDARVMKTHFAELMKDPPPVFVPPRKYNTVRRRAEEAAAAANPSAAVHPLSRSDKGYSEAPESPGMFDMGDSGDEEGYGSPYGMGTPGPMDVPMPAVMVDPFALPLPVNSRSRSGSPAILAAAPNVAPPPLPLPLPLPPPPHQPPTALPYAPDQQPALNSPSSTTEVLPNQSLITPSALLPSATFFPGSQSPSPGLATVSLANGTPMAKSVSGGSKVRLIAKLPCEGDLPAISRFFVQTVPSTIPITLDNSLVRQHSFVVPHATERVDFSLFFRRPTSSSTSKGKSKAINQSAPSTEEADEKETTSTPTPADDELPVVKLSIRPIGTPFSEIRTKVDHGNGDTEKEDKKEDAVNGESVPVLTYLLSPKAGLTVVEFVVSPPGGAETEVYRVFLTK